MTVVPTRKSTLYICLLATAMAGVQFVYSIQFAVGGPLLQNTYKLSGALMSILLTTSGAISGFLVQPIIGVYSDSCQSKWGRRRPFVFWGAALCVIGMAMVGNSVQIGLALGDKADGLHPSDHMYGLVIAVAFLWLINISVNAMQGPARALISDLLPPDQQQEGNAIVTLITGASNIIANVVGAQFLLAEDPYRWLFIMGCVFTTVTAIPTLIVAKETRYVPEKVAKTSPIDVFKKIGVTFVGMPNVVARIFTVFFASWASFTPFLYFITVYFAENVKGATNSPDDKIDYQKGVQLGMYALAIYAAVSTLFSMVIAKWIYQMGIKTTYFSSQVLATICYAVLWICSVENVYANPTHAIIIALVFTSLVAVNFTAFNSIPFALLADSVSKEETGLYMGVLNSAATVSQVFTNLIVSQVVLRYSDSDYAWTLGFGALLSVIASMLVFILKVPVSGKPLKEIVTEKTPLVQ